MKVRKHTPRIDITYALPENGQVMFHMFSNMKMGPNLGVKDINHTKR